MVRGIIKQRNDTHRSHGERAEDSKPGSACLPLGIRIGSSFDCHSQGIPKHHIGSYVLKIV
jgi:hypothetical protein